jgi:hypothetical protein
MTAALVAFDNFDWGLGFHDDYATY